MDAKYLIGFELSIDINLNLFNNHDINIELLNKIVSFAKDNFDIRHTIYVENEKIQIFCVTETTEVMLRSRGRDEISKALIKSVQEKYQNMFFKDEYNHIRFEISPMYFVIRYGRFFIGKYNSLNEASELDNTDLWYEYYAKYQCEVDTCCCYNCKKRE